MTKALALLSGGLDSILAAKVVKDLGIEVTGVCFASAFFGEKNAVRMAAQIDIPLIVYDFTEAHLEMTKHPKYGYGKNMNPCIDCHAMMLKYAGKILEEQQMDFIITGEVLNQRPMSQNKKSLDIVKKESGYEKKILRPLCAKNLPETEMEQNGLVDREKLLDFSGKSRKPQIELAKQLGIVDYPAPAGGCMLTEPQFADRLRDLYEDSIDTINPHDIELLKIGRHFRIKHGIKAVSTRDQEEYKRLMELLTDDYIVFNTAECNGSTLILATLENVILTEEDYILAAAITARYSKDKGKDSVAVKYKKNSEDEYTFINVKPEPEENIKKLLI